MICKVLQKWWASHFGSQELLALILRQESETLLDVDQKRINAWVDAIDGRKTTYEKYIRLIPFLNKVRDAEGHQIHLVLRDLKKEFPEFFGDIKEEMTVYTLQAAVDSYIHLVSIQLAKKVVFGFRWVVAFRLVLCWLIVFLAILIAIETVKLR